jgi:hypothetical protein
MSKEDRASRETERAQLPQWKDAIKRLFDRIEQYFADLANDGLVSFRRQKVTITEEPAGRYDTESLIMSLAGRNVVFQPIGFWMIGSFGRIDLFREGHRSVSYMLLRPKDTDDWKLMQRSNEQWTRTAPGSQPTYDLGPVSRQSLEKAIETLL